jgi:hypothetical protein
MLSTMDMTHHHPATPTSLRARATLIRTSRCALWTSFGLEKLTFEPCRYDPRHTIPTIKKYYEEKEARHKDNEDGALTEDQLRGAKDVLKREDREDGEDDEDEEARLKAMVDKQMKSNGYTDAEVGFLPLDRAETGRRAEPGRREKRKEREDEGRP